MAYRRAICRVWARVGMWAAEQVTMQWLQLNRDPVTYPTSCSASYAPSARVCPCAYHSGPFLGCRRASAR